MSCELCENVTYYSKETCVECEGICKTCLSKEVCTSCIDDATLENGKCFCDIGYKEIADECIRANFSLIFGIFQNNTVWIKFNESLTLKRNQIDVQPSLFSLKSIELVRIDDNLYNIELELEKDPQAGSQVKISLVGQIVSKQNSVLIKRKINLSLFVTDNIKEETAIKQEILIARETAQKTKIVIASTAAAASLFAGDVNSIFSFLNIAEMLYSVYFFKVELYSPFIELILGLRVHSSMPNLFSLIIPESLGISLPANYQKYGFKTNLILLNCGIQLSMLLIFFFIFLISLIFKKLNIMPKISALLVSHFRYGIFLRLMIQSYFDLLLASYVGIAYGNLSESTQIFNFVVCIIL